MSDEEILQLYLDRDESAIAATRERYNNYLYKVAYQILGDHGDAEECLNDVYLAAWDSVPRNRPGKLATYLGKIARRTAVDMLRKRDAGRRVPSEYIVSVEELAEAIPGGDGPEEALDRDALEAAIREFVHGLPTEQKRMFIGRYFYFDPLREVAAYCGVRESKAKSMLFRLRKRLKEYLETEGFMV